MYILRTNRSEIVYEISEIVLSNIKMTDENKIKYRYTCSENDMIRIIVKNPS